MTDTKEVPVIEMGRPGTGRAVKKLVDEATAAAKTCRDKGKAFFAFVVPVESTSGPADEVTEVVDALHAYGWTAQSLTSMSQFSVLIVFRSTVPGY